MTQAESPECTPASSTCSMTAPMSTSPARSRMASTSTSMASSRNRSMRIGRSVAEHALGAERQLGERKPKSVVVVDDLHRPAAEHVARPQQRRVADAPDDGERLVHRAGRPPSGAVGCRAARRPPTRARGPRRRRWLLGLVPRMSSAGRRPARRSGVWPPSETITPTTPPAPAPSRPPRRRARPPR